MSFGQVVASMQSWVTDVELYISYEIEKNIFYQIIEQKEQEYSHLLHLMNSNTQLDPNVSFIFTV